MSAPDRPRWPRRRLWRYRPPLRVVVVVIVVANSPLGKSLVFQTVQQCTDVSLVGRPKRNWRARNSESGLFSLFFRTCKPFFARSVKVDGAVRWVMVNCDLRAFWTTFSDTRSHFMSHDNRPGVTWYNERFPAGEIIRRLYDLSWWDYCINLYIACINNLFSSNQNTSISNNIFKYFQNDLSITFMVLNRIRVYRRDSYDIKFFRFISLSELIPASDAFSPT